MSDSQSGDVGFKSHRCQFGALDEMGKLPAFHAGERGSIPLCVIIVSYPVCDMLINQCICGIILTDGRCCDELYCLSVSLISK